MLSRARRLLGPFVPLALFLGAWWLLSNLLAAELPSRWPDWFDRYWLWGDLIRTYRAAWFAIPLAAAVIGATRALARMQPLGDARFERVRSFLGRHPLAMALLTSVPALAWTTWVVPDFDVAPGQIPPWGTSYPGLTLSTLIVRHTVPAVLSFLFVTCLMRLAASALFAPMVRHVEAARRGPELDAEGLSFDAVAITGQTIGAVGGMMLFTTVMVMAVNSRWVVRVVPEAVMTTLLGVYVATALGGAYVFARKSKIAIGIDGVLVGGSTKQRFLAYRDIDHVRVVADIIELRSSTSALLRLQLHGKDAQRRAAIVERLEAAIARAHALRADPTASFVESASADDLVRAAGGASSYRVAAPSRDDLWDVFESPVLAPESRRAAAEALASGIEDTERSRFRIAAEQIAEPATRAHLRELVEDEPAAPRRMRRQA